MTPVSAQYSAAGAVKWATVKYREIPIPNALSVQLAHITQRGALRIFVPSAVTGLSVLIILTVAFKALPATIHDTLCPKGTVFFVPPSDHKEPQPVPVSHPRHPRRVVHPDTPSWLMRAIVLTLLAWWGSQALAHIAYSLRDMLITVATSFIAASALEVPVSLLANKGLRRWLATLVVIVSLLLGFLGFAVAVGATVASQVSHLLTSAPEIAQSTVKTLNRWFHTRISPTSVAAHLHHLSLSRLAQTHHHSIEASSRGALTQLGSLLMGLLVTYYLVADGPRLRHAACSVLPPRSQIEFIRAWEIAIEKTSGYFVSRAMLVVVRMLALAPVLAVLSVPAWLVLSLWFAVVAEFIPIVGTLTGALLPVAVAFSVSPAAGIIVLVYITAFTQVRNMVLAPKLTRRTVNMHPAIAFLSVIAATKLVGPAGALLAIPALATFQAFFSSYIARHDLAAESTLLPRK